MDILTLHNQPETIAAKTAAIRKAMQDGAEHFRQPNFERICTADLARLFELYDHAFLGGWLGQAVKATGFPLRFGLSRRMTRAGGKTTKCKRRDGKAGYFEISIASRMLFMTFADVDRPVLVCGLTCKDRLEALQRIMEHELVHLAELLVWDRSSCSGQRFKDLARNIFGHADTKHALVTAREHAAVRHGIAVGSVVEFQHEGRRFVGRVNRIHRRATVLVEDASGRPFSDGKRYVGFYVPLEMLTPMQGQGGVMGGQ